MNRQNAALLRKEEKRFQEFRETYISIVTRTLKEIEGIVVQERRMISRYKKEKNHFPDLSTLKQKMGYLEYQERTKEEFASYMAGLRIFRTHEGYSRRKKQAKVSARRRYFRSAIK